MNDKLQSLFLIRRTRDASQWEGKLLTRDKSNQSFSATYKLKSLSILI